MNILEAFPLTECDCFFGLAIECSGKYPENLFDLSVLFEYYLFVNNKG